MHIKVIESEEEIKQAADLAYLCFHEWPIEKNISFYKKLKDCYFIGLFENSKLVSAGGSYEFQIFIKDKIFKCSGIAHIMTDPRSRRKGYVRKIMNQLLQEKFSKGFEVSALWPFEHSFYQKFGYELAEKTIVYKFSPSDIKSEFNFTNKFSFRKMIEEIDYPLLNQVSKNAINKNTRIIGKHDAWFLRGAFDDFLTFIIEENDNPKGFLTIKFRKPKDKEWGQNLIVLDFAYETLEVKKAIFAFLRNFESDIENIILYCPPQEEIFSYLKGIKTEHKIATWPSMIRILNIKKFMEQLVFTERINTVLYAKITDNCIPENNDNWKFIIKEGKCSVESCKEEVPAESVLEISIGEFSQLVIGYQNARKLFETKIETIPREWLDESIFSEEPCMKGIWF